MTNSYDTALMLIQALFAAIFGLAFGSFGTVLATRLISDESISKEPSHCRGCGTPLTWRQNIPLFSWLVQRGRCAQCGEKISIAYPVCEATTALLFVGTVGQSLSIEAIAMAGLAVVTAPMIWTDLKTHRLPNAMTYGLALFGALTALATFILDGNPSRLVTAFTWGLVPAAAMFLLNLLSRGGMGMGDVKLSLGLGLILSIQSTAAMSTAFILAFAVAAIVAALTLALRKTSLKAAIPFGPYLLLGSWVSYLVGTTLQAFITAPWAVTF